MAKTNYQLRGSIKSEYDLRTFEKSKYQGDCASCGNYVGAYSGYKSFVNGKDVILHVQCYVNYVAPILRDLGVIK